MQAVQKLPLVSANAPGPHHGRLARELSMDIGMRIQLKMTQQLVMTPQLVQAIRLLQLSRLELVEEIRKELDGNPLLGDDGGADATSSRENVTGTREIPATDNDRAERIPEHSDTDLAARDTEKRVKEVDWEQFLENRQMQRTRSIRSFLFL